ncbi:2-C-methyl-D-erythritol 2,4-cyclodiphosphate synthase [Thermosipho atlanticus DSM 15807]|uniref:2-C-methyl-D-erythritol 2,4-cyclodiphosphate synthase n=1 Tax=Thermosipho atlanticus DSM 15807 TaxID=1123380 RepID=A0A1M5RVP5_9BACT|nr:2-C-methyl-D-erythritol 2,4-cyclodiphosphate synthase [Thermosipho atlanticus DSM 15807]
MRITKINEKNYKECVTLIYREKKEYFDFLFKNPIKIIEKAVSRSIPPFLPENSIVFEDNKGNVLGVLLFAPKSAFRHGYEKWFKVLGFKVFGTGLKLSSIIGQILINFTVDDVYMISVSGKSLDVEYELLYHFITSHEFSRIIADVPKSILEKYRIFGFVESQVFNDRIVRMHKKMSYKTASGIGWDTHPLVKDRKLVLGGIEIPYDFGLKGHSDADVLVHSIIDSLIGVSLKMDIGKVFPEDKVPEGMSSMKMLEEVLRMIKSKGYFPTSIDCVIISKYKLGQFREDIANNLSDTLSCPVSLKFKTGNEVYPESKGLGITSICVSNLIVI